MFLPMMEKWRDVKGYEGLYQISNYGRVKSLFRKVNCKGGKFRNVPERIMKTYINSKGYEHLILHKYNTDKTITIHKLIAISFFNCVLINQKLVIDHKDNNKLNNNLWNLQIITNRKNTSKDRKNGTSKYVGVCWYKKYNKWRASIYIKNKQIFLGYFINELDAAKAYQDKLKEIK